MANDKWKIETKNEKQKTLIIAQFPSGIWRRSSDKLTSKVRRDDGSIVANELKTTLHDYV